MSDREMPDTDHDLIVSMWTLLVGTNGNGLLGKFEDFAKETGNRLVNIESKLPAMWTRDDHEAAEKARAECEDQTKDRRHMSKWQWVSIVIAILALIATGISAYAFMEQAALMAKQLQMVIK